MLWFVHAFKMRSWFQSFSKRLDGDLVKMRCKLKCQEITNKHFFSICFSSLVLSGKYLGWSTCPACKTIWCVSKHSILSPAYLLHANIHILWQEHDWVVYSLLYYIINVRHFYSRSQHLRAKMEWSCLKVTPLLIMVSRMQSSVLFAIKIDTHFGRLYSDFGFSLFVVANSNKIFNTKAVAIIIFMI